MQVAEGSRSFVLRILRNSLSLVQAARSNASTSVAYVRTQLSLDASRGWVSLISIAFTKKQLVSGAGHLGNASTFVAYVKMQLYLDASRGRVSLLCIAYTKKQLVSSASRRE